MIDATEIQESAESCIAALLVIDSNDLISECINVLGTDPRIMPNAHYKAVFQAILPRLATKSNKLRFCSFFVSTPIIRSGYRPLYPLPLMGWGGGGRGDHTH